jgi:hypothetical protein
MNSIFAVDDRSWGQMQHCCRVRLNPAPYGCHSTCQPKIVLAEPGDVGRGRPVNAQIGFWRTPVDAFWIDDQKTQSVGE